MKELVRVTLHVAHQEIGIREVGNNRGKRVIEYLNSVGLGGGNPWCAAFVYWCIEQAAHHLKERNPAIRTGYCPYIANFGRDTRTLTDRPEAGDTFLVYGISHGVFRAHHTGLVTGLTDGGRRFATIEGNTNIDGSSEGIGVFARDRPISSKYKFVRWGNLVEGDEPDVATAYDLFLNQTHLTKMPLRGGKALCPVAVWARALGFKLAWDQEDQSVSLNGVEIPTQITLIDSIAFAPIRELVEFSGLKIEVEGKVVRVHR